MRRVVDRNVVMRRMTVHATKWWDSKLFSLRSRSAVKLVATSDTALFFFAGATQCVETVPGKRDSHSSYLYPLLK